MEKQDLLILVIAIAIVAVLGIFVKPILSGSGSSGSPAQGSETVIWDTPRPRPTEAATTGVPTTVTPVPTPSWDRTPVDIGFVEPTNASGSLTPFPTIPPDTAPNRTMITYATIEGQWSGTTQVFSIPFPYWQIEYTAEPMALPPDIYPRIIIQVFDVNDPNRFVRIMDQDVFTAKQENPWVEKIYEGNRDYYFRITTRFIRSYTITIKVPGTYA